MLTIDLHTHTSCGHGQNTVKEMYEKGKELGLKIHGFSEHSPRPVGYNYEKDYRNHLINMIPYYLSDVKTLKENQTDVKVLLGMEVDWIEKQQDFVKNIVDAFPFDYLIGGIHFLGTWGFDVDKVSWGQFSYFQKSFFFREYYSTMQAMIKSEFFNILAHPDLVKIFAIDEFKKWREEEENKNLIYETLVLAKKHNIVMEVSSAGLRKPCNEIYPYEGMMQMAKELDIPISIASDGHCVDTLASHFDELEEYIRRFGFTECVYFENKTPVTISF